MKVLQKRKVHIFAQNLAQGLLTLTDGPTGSLHLVATGDLHLLLPRDEFAIEGQLAEAREEGLWNVKNGTKDAVAISCVVKLCAEWNRER